MPASAFIQHLFAPQSRSSQTTAREDAQTTATINAKAAKGGKHESQRLDDSGRKGYLAH